MSKWGKPTKNRKRIDPRYFINETVNRDLKEYATADPPKSSPLSDPKMGAPRRAADPVYVFNALSHYYNRGVHPSQRRGMPFGGMGVDTILDALMIDDIWPEQEEALQKIVTDGGAQSMEEFAPMVADWLTKYRRGEHLTD